MGTIYVNLNDTLTREEQINNICDYIFADIYNTKLDIICIQGISDTKMAKLLINKINKYNNKIPFEIIPIVNLDEFHKYDSTFEMTWHTHSTSGDLETNITELLLSRYPIISSNIYNLYENAETKIIEQNRIIIANINIDGYLFTIINISLFGDTVGGISGAKFRKHEIQSLNNIIQKNSKEITNFINDNKLNIINKNIVFICGLYNIIELKNDKINIELINILKQLNCLDIFRFISTSNNQNNSGINNSFHTRDCYICLQLHNHKSDEEYSNTNQLSKKIYDEYGLTFINSYVLKNYKILDYFPLETIFILDKKEKSKN
jgi:hypothetical protein